MARFAKAKITNGVGESVALGDFNGDGKTDVATANGGNGGTSVYLGNGDGTFGIPAYYGTGAPARVVAADFNGDGKADLVVAGTDGFDILLGNGDGTFQAPVLFSGSASHFQATGCRGRFQWGRQNGLSRRISSFRRRRFSVLYGNGDGTFQAGPSPMRRATVLLYSMAAGDFNQDSQDGRRRGI